MDTNQLAIYQSGQGFEPPGSERELIQLVVRTGLLNSRLRITISTL